MHPSAITSVDDFGANGVCGSNACDTVVLNVAGTNGMYCHMSYLSSAARTAIVRFVEAGGKLVIYDSECPAQDYSWLPYTFNTNNPGAMGASGTLNIVENNPLSSSDTSSPYFIDTYILGHNSDAVGDMNVMITYNANWCLDMSVTNVRLVTGPVHTYARYGNGLIIYNGMDQDPNRDYCQPGTTNGCTNESKVWYQELLIPFNPTPVTVLPCGVTVVGITLSPMTATNDLSMRQNSHTVTANLTDQLNNPEPGIPVSFTVTGVNAGVMGSCNPVSCVTDASGNVTFTYTNVGNVAGNDTIVATFTNNGVSISSQPAMKTWINPCDLNGDNKIDRSDIGIIFAGHGQQAPGDPRDIDGDGWITVRDARMCTLRCTNLNCAP